MLYILSDEEVEQRHQELRDWLEDVFKHKYPNWVYNMISQLQTASEEYKEK